MLQQQTNQAPQVGDLVFAHSNGLMGRLIRVGERLRWGEHASYWNHAAIVNRIDNNGVAFVIQADIRGVNEAPLSSVGEYRLRKIPDGVSQDAVLEFLRGQVGSKYGVLSILCIALDLITWNAAPDLRRSGTWICSALVAESLRAGGWFSPASNYGDIYTVTPAQLWTSLLH
jgi:hypothetical protein